MAYDNRFICALMAYLNEKIRLREIQRAAKLAEERLIAPPGWELR